MYKDVWKKFGVKVMIVLCSVLLLGGVAIAAPRLQAADPLNADEYEFVAKVPYKFDVDALANGQQNVKATIVKNDITKIEYFKKGQYAPEATAEGTLWLSNNDFNIADETITSDFDVEIYSTVFSGRPTVRAKFVVEKLRNGINGYQGAKCYINESSKNLGKNNVYFTQSLSASDPFVQGDVVVKITINDTEYTLPVSEYRYLGGDVVAAGNNSQFKINLTNIYTGAGDDGSELSSTSYSIRRNMDENLVIKIGNQNVYPGMVIDNNDKKAVEDSVSIWDGATELIDIAANGLTKNYDTDTLTLTITSNGIKYQDPEANNILTCTFNTNTGNTTFRWLDGSITSSEEALEFGVSGDNYVELWNGLGYAIIPQSLLYRASNGNTREIPYRNAQGKTNYEITSARIVGGVGTTAGLVEIGVQGSKETEFRSASATLRYYVKRSLRNAIVTLTLSKDRYEYTNDGANQNPEEIYIQYNEQDKTQVNHPDNRNLFNVSYLRDGVATTDRKRAGTITVAVSGNGNTTNGGYIDNAMTASYEIYQKDLSGYTAQLKGDNEVEGWQRYIYTGQPAPVTGSAVFVNKNEPILVDQEISINNNKLESSDIRRFTYKKLNIDNNQWEDVGEAIDPGYYEVTYHFTGNYTGSTSARFQIYTYPLSQCEIVFTGGCSHNNGGNHIYDRTEHKPNFIVTLKGSPSEIIPKAAYTDPVYTNNTNAGTGTVTIRSTTTDDILTKDFTIEQYDLDQEKSLILPSSFVPDTDVKKHDYVGKTNKPPLPTVSLDGKDWELVKGTDFINYREGSTASNVIDVVAINADGNYVSTNASNYPKLNQKYAFRVRGTGNFKGSAYTEEFELKGKPISDVSVKKTIDPKPRNDANTFKEHAEKVDVWDDTLKEALVLNTDFIVKDVPDIDTLGEVTFTIEADPKGCYTGTDKVSFKYGESIDNVRVFAPGRVEVEPNDKGELWLGNDLGFYWNGSKYNNINFLKNSNDPNTDPDLNSYYFLAYPNDIFGQRLYYDEDGKSTDPDTYLVQWNPPTYADQGFGEGIGSITLTGQHGYYGTKTIYVKVSQAVLDSTYEVELSYLPDVEVNPDSKNPIYSGKVIRPRVVSVVKKANGVTVASLTEGVDFEVVYPSGEDLSVNINAGSQARVYIRGKNGYSGQIARYFTIEKRDLQQARDAGMLQILGLEEAFDYATSSMVDGKKWPGVRPTDFTVQFNPDGNFVQASNLTIDLIRNTDFSTSYEHVEHAWEKTDKYSQYPAPTIYITSMNNSNFKGVLPITFEIAPMDLSNESKCEVRLDQKQVFTGKKLTPSVTVWYNGNLIENYATDDKDKTTELNYHCDYESGDTTFVGESANTAFFIITPINSRDIIERRVVYFNILGDLNPEENSDAAKNSAVRFTIQPVVYQSAENPLGENPQFFSSVRFYQQEDGIFNMLNNPFMRQMLWPTDYTVEYLGAKTVGSHLATVKATEGGRLFGTRSEEIIIQGDLSKKSVTTYNGSAQNDSEEDPVVRISVTSGSAVVQDLVDQISPVWCGGKKLEYGTDYTLEGWDSSLGEHTIVMKKLNDSILYLDNQRNIRYEITQGIDGLDVVGLKDRYEYAHGSSVINTGLLRVELNGITLGSEDYTINLVNDKEVTTESGGYIEIIGQGKYSGKVIKRFTIYPYNLTEHKEAQDIEVEYAETVGYTGEEVFPEVAAIWVNTGNNRRLDLTTQDPIEYRLVGHGDGDRINYTKDGESNLPTCRIISTTSNYSGYLELKYRITRQGIADKDKVVFDKIDPQKYLNGREINPDIRATNAVSGKTLVGVPYGSVNDESSTNADFTYQYGPDCRNAGEQKVIYIRGIGNYSGTTEIYFDIIPKDISEDDVTVDVGEALTYNGKEQIPAFTMQYANDDILSYNGSEFSFLIMRGASIENPMNNKNAGRASFTIVPNDTNYTGSKTVSFRIEPASLTDHTNFIYQLNEDKQVNLNSYRLNLPWEEGVSRKIEHPNLDMTTQALAIGEVAAYYSIRDNNGVYMQPGEDYDYTITRAYVEPDSDDVPIREGFGDEPNFTYAGKVKVTIEGKGNYIDSASYWYFIGTDISDDANIRMEPTTTVYNSQIQTPTVKVSGVEDGKYTIAYYRNEAIAANRIGEKDFVNAGTYYVRVEGKPSKGTYATKPHTLTYTITPRPLSNSIVIDGFKKEYAYTGLEIRPIGISVTDYIDRIKYRLTEDLDYTLSYSNNLNAGTAYINIKGQNNFSGTATANFLITSSTISSGSSTTPNTPINQGTGEISGSMAVSPSNVILTMDTANAMHYTGNPVYPKVSIAGMTENIDYTVTFSNNTEVGTATVTITGIGNNRGTITKTFNIIAPLSNCKIAEIPPQQYTGSAVEPTLTVTCGNNILIPGTDYNVTYANNINIGTATATIRAASNSKYTGSATVNFSIANDVGGFIISGYAPSYTYTGNAITPSVIVETGSGRLTQGTDYTVSYSNNINAGKATITVKGIGRYSGTQTANFVIEAKSIQGCDTTQVEDRTYTGDAYTPTITVTDGNRVLTSGVDYTVTYTNNTEPGTASILIQGMSNNYSGTKVINFKIAAVAVKGLKASKLTYKSLKLKWTKQGYADGYQICDARSKVVKNVTKNSASITGLTAGKTYKYKVRSYIRNADGTRSYGAFSSVVSATTKLKAPTVKVVSKKAGKARISWSKVAGANGYEIYYKKSSSDTYRKLKTVNNANVRICNVSGLKSGDRAYFRVRAFKKSGSKKIYSPMNKLKVITVK